MARYEPYSDAEDPRFARYDRSGRYDDYRYSGTGTTGTTGTRGRTEHYDGYSERPSPDSLASRGRARYDTFEPNGYEWRGQGPPRAYDEPVRRQGYRGDPRRPEPPVRDARDHDSHRADPRTSSREPAPNGSGAHGPRDRHVPDGRHGPDSRRRGTGERAAESGYDERPARPRSDYSGRQPRPGRQAGADRQSPADPYDQYDHDDWPRRARDQPGTSSARTSRNGSQPRIPPPGSQSRIPPSGAQPSVSQTSSQPRTSHARTSHARTSRSVEPLPGQSRPRPASSRDPHDLPRFGHDYERDVDTAGRPRFVPYDDGGRSAPPPPTRGGRSPWLVFAAACVVAVVVLVVAAMSRGRGDAGSSAADLSSAQTTVPGPSGAATGTPQAQYDQEIPIMRDGARVGVVTVGRPEGVDSFYAGTYTPDHGALFATFKVTMRNVSGGPIECNMFEFYVRSAAGDRLDPTIGRDPAFETGSLDPGETTSGWISFDAGDHGTLVYSPSAFGMVVAEWSF